MEIAKTGLSTRLHTTKSVKMSTECIIRCAHSLCSFNLSRRWRITHNIIYEINRCFLISFISTIPLECTVQARELNGQTRITFVGNLVKCILDDKFLGRFQHTIQIFIIYKVNDEYLGKTIFLRSRNLFQSTTNYQCSHIHRLL